VVFQAALGTGGDQRRSPTGGSAYGMPRKTRWPDGNSKPRIAPCVVLTTTGFDIAARTSISGCRRLRPAAAPTLSSRAPSRQCEWRSPQQKHPITQDQPAPKNSPTPTRAGHDPPPLARCARSTKARAGWLHAGWSLHCHWSLLERPPACPRPPPRASPAS
jgi:hypothetical protein